MSLLVALPSISELRGNAPLKPITLPEEAQQLPLECRDMLLRLLEYKPEARIRNIFGLQRIAMYKDFKFEDVKKRKVKTRCAHIFAIPDLCY